VAHPKLNDVRRRYHYRCGYCGVSETDIGGELTVDHFLPPKSGGDEILMYQIVDNGCGYSLVSHTWIKPSDDSTWKLKEQRYVPRKGKDQDHYDADSKEWNKKVAQTIMVKWY